MILYADPAISKTGRIVVLLEYLFFSVLTLMPTPFLLHCCGENVKSSAFLHAEITLWSIFWGMMIVAQFTDIFYSIAPDHMYFRGPWFPLLILPLTVIILLNVAELLKRRKKFQIRIFAAQLVFLLPTSVLTIAYMFAPVDILLMFWMVLCAITLFTLILTDSIEQYVRQQQEIAH